MLEIADALNITATQIANIYDATAKALSDHFETAKNTKYKIYKYREAEHEQGETLDQFHVRLYVLAKNCDSADFDKEIQLEVVQKCHSAHLRHRALIAS